MKRAAVIVVGLLLSNQSLGQDRIADIPGNSRVPEYRLERILPLHRVTVTSLAIHPQNPVILATKGLDSMVRVTDTRSGREIWNASIRTSSSGSIPVVFSPSGRMVATADYRDIVYLFDSATGEELHRYNLAFDRFESDYSVSVLWFTEDERKLVAAVDESIYVVDVATGVVERSIHTHVNSWFQSAELGDDGTIRATVAGDLLGWDAADAELPSGRLVPNFVSGSCGGPLRVNSFYVVCSAFDAYLADPQRPGDIVDFSEHTGDIEGMSVVFGGTTLVTRNFSI